MNMIQKAPQFTFLPSNVLSFSLFLSLPFLFTSTQNILKVCKKKDVNLRMVVDYQALKAITTLIYDRSRATLGDNQESMKAPKGLPSGRLTTKSAKETSMIARSRYGVTQGPPDSPARGQQCNDLVRANHYAFRCCPSYGNDQSKWRRWFCDLKGNKEIMQAVRHQAQVEGVEGSIPDVRP